MHALSPAAREAPRHQPCTAECGTGAAPEPRAMESLEAEITELWCHITAVTYRFLELVAEYDRRRGYGLHGLASCAQWLNWQCGIGEVAAREKVRVARALEGLPRIADSFRRGVLSYSKVRAVTRVATPENEAALLDVAESATAAQVERVVQRYRRGGRLEAATAMAAHRDRGVHCFRDEDGTIVIRARLPAELGEIVLRAIEEAVHVAERVPEQAPDADRAPPLEGAVAELPLGTPTGKSAANDYVASAVETESNVPAETPVDDVRDSFAAKRADALCLMAEWFLNRRTDECGSAADRFQVVVHVDQRLLARGNGMRRVEKDERCESAQGAQSVESVESAEDDEFLASHHAAGEEAPLRCELEDGHALAVETARRLACDASLVGMIDDANGEPLNVGRKTRTISPALERALDARDGGCRFPGCGRTRFKQGHHVIHWANGGETSLGNIVTLCRFHHRLVHEGGFGVHIVEGAAAAERFAFTRPDGTRVEPNGRCFRGNILGSGAADVHDEPASFALDGGHGFGIDVAANRSGWRGERMDYGLAMQALARRRDLSHREAAP